MAADWQWSIGSGTQHSCRQLGRRAYLDKSLQASRIRKPIFILVVCGAVIWFTNASQPQPLPTTTPTEAVQENPTPTIVPTESETQEVESVDVDASDSSSLDQTQKDIDNL